MTTPLQPKDALLRGIDVWFWATSSLDETHVGSLLSVLSPSERVGFDVERVVAGHRHWR